MITQFNCYSVWEQDLECAQAKCKAELSSSSHFTKWSCSGH